MIITIPVFAYKSTQNTWLGKLIDCTDPANPVTHDLTGFTKVYIIFIKPDGTQTPTDAQMEAGFNQGAVLETPGTPTDSNIQFENLTLPSILDQNGPWEYVPAALINNSLIKSGITSQFWVP